MSVSLFLKTRHIFMTQTVKGAAPTMSPPLSMASTLATADASGALHGVQRRPLTVHRDARGSFTEMFCDGWGLPIRPEQWSLVASKARVLRGMHLHQRHDEYVAVVQGRACVGLYDMRPHSPTAGRSALIELDSGDLTCLSFPRGILHGWYFYEDSLHLQAVSEQYSDYAPDDNDGCLWSDPALRLHWPDAAPILSPRAAAFPTLAQLKRKIGQPG
jgi:dTDP-4-dehydrorhamnose 3,5-epimerase